MFAGEENPIYAAFASSNGRTSAEQLSVDRGRRTGKMLDFFLWVGRKRSEYCKSGGSMMDRDAWIEFVTATR